MSIIKKALIAGCWLLSFGTATAAGFQINLQGLRQLAMGNTGVAYPWDNAVIFYNPGALSRLEHGMVSGSVFGIFPTTQLLQNTTGASSTSVSQVFTPFNLYGSTPVRQVKGLSLGLGIYTPFGTGLKWDDDWTGRYVTQDIGLQSIFFQPTAGYRINELVSVGVGFVYATGNFHLNKAIPLQFQNGNDGQAKLKGNANGMGYNLGVHLQLHPKISAGISYRSGVTMKVKNGDATFSVPASVASNFPNTTFSTELPLPSVLSVGLAAKATKDLTISVEGNFVGWKKYDTLRFDYEQQTPALQNTRAPRQYENTFTVRLGLQYTINNKLDVMIGGSYDNSPVRDNLVSPDLPDSDRMVLTAGLNVKATSRLDINGVVEFVNAQKRDGWYAAENFGGTYQTRAFTIGVGASYTFKK